MAEMSVSASIDKGQMEVAEALDLSAGQTMNRSSMPQAFKNVLPALMIVLLKKSELSVILELPISRSGYTGAEPYLQCFRAADSPQRCFTGCWLQSLHTLQENWRVRLRKE